MRDRENSDGFFLPLLSRGKEEQREADSKRKVHKDGHTQKRIFREGKHNTEVGQGAVGSGDFHAPWRREMTTLIRSQRLRVPGTSFYA